ncbi:hypothetical protein TWF506_003783 [Arthrobotrys conoides]|uniref:Carboxylesterase type B domain-containing protein n=1 Tax=Arthrobotrys conoides TaxID=74498 RepID=A0AAN8N2U2_9PEZI
MSSGSIIPTNPVDSEKAQAVYDRVVRAAGCDQASSIFSSVSSRVSSEPAPMGYNGFAIAYGPRSGNRTVLDSPERLVASGKYAAVPMIQGSMEDEGTLTSLFQPNVTTTALLAQYLKQLYFWRASEAELVDYTSTYGNEFSGAVLGSPFRTGTDNELFPGFELRAALIGTPYLGTSHGSDVIPIFSGNTTVHAANELQTAFLNFIYTLDPDGKLEPGKKTPLWLQWSMDYQQLQIFPDSSRLVVDNYRAESFDWILKHVDILHF